MAVTINGSTNQVDLGSNGTIANLAEGGLTDAKIVHADIKDGTITEAKLDIHAAPSGTDKYLAYTSNGMEWATVSSDPTTTSGTNNFTVADGNLVIATAGHGIDFSATANAGQNSPTMSNELLDDYEEGSWTPALKGITTEGTGTYPTLAGSYTKIGRMVFCSVTMYQSAHTGAGNMRMDGLPFTAHLSNGTYTNSDGSHNITGINGESVNASKHQIIGHLENYQTRFRIYQVGSNGSTVSPSWVSIEDGDVWFSGNFMYETNS